MRSNWARATDPKPDRECVRCGEDRPDMIDHNERGYHCNVCGQSWGLKPPEPKP